MDTEKIIREAYQTAELENVKIKRFDCYPSGTVILAQLGVLGALDAALHPEARRPAGAGPQIVVQHMTSVRTPIRIREYRCVSRAM
jgi:hypothetical protein